MSPQNGALPLIPLHRPSTAFWSKTALASWIPASYPPEFRLKRCNEGVRVRLYQAAPRPDWMLVSGPNRRSLAASASSRVAHELSVDAELTTVGRPVPWHNVCLMVKHGHFGKRSRCRDLGTRVCRYPSCTRTARKGTTSVSSVSGTVVHVAPTRLPVAGPDSAPRSHRGSEARAPARNPAALPPPRHRPHDIDVVPAIERHVPVKE